MESDLVNLMRLSTPPIGLAFSSVAPSQALSYRPGKMPKTKWGCSLYLIAKAFQGSTVCFSQQTCICPGANQGLALGFPVNGFPMDYPDTLHFLSCGSRGCPNCEEIKQKYLDCGVSLNLIDEILDGEKFKKNPELTAKTFENYPQYSPPAPILIFKPLSLFSPQEPPLIVVFLVDAIELSALLVLANFAYTSWDKVMAP
ncbi:MAG: DUF169 domain-containing protein, partial [Deltaproteobacteria bacterium]|nr:DUF169 domain-containing protein [Deltaproteobacteria bacterium]